MLPTLYIYYVSVQFLTMVTLYGTVVEWAMPDCWIIFKEGHPKYIILAAIIISSSIIYIYFCIMHCIYFRILFTRAPIDSRALRSDGTTLVLGLLFLFSIKVSFIQQWTCKADFYHHDSRSQFRYDIHKHSPGLPLNRKN